MFHFAGLNMFWKRSRRSTY